MPEASKEAVVMGRLLAAMTHDIRNVLAVIKESAGLVEDILSLNADREIPHREKIDKSLKNIRSQVERGVNLSTHFNQFAHSMDENRSQAPLDDLIRLSTALNLRFARLGKIDLAVEETECPSGASCFAFEAILVMTRVFDALLKAVGEEGRICLKLLAGDDEKAVLFRIESPGGGGLDPEITTRINADISQWDVMVTPVAGESDCLKLVFGSR